MSPCSMPSASPSHPGTSTDLDGLRLRERRTEDRAGRSVAVSGEPLYTLLPCCPHLVSPRNPAVEETPRTGRPKRPGAAGH